jgi:predicted transcriptional regulator
MELVMKKTHHQSHPVTLRIPPDTWERIEQLAQAERRPPQNLLRNLIDDGIAAQQGRDTAVAA